MPQLQKLPQKRKQPGNTSVAGKLTAFATEMCVFVADGVVVALPRRDVHKTADGRLIAVH